MLHEKADEAATQFHVPHNLKMPYVLKISAMKLITGQPSDGPDDGKRPCEIGAAGELSQLRAKPSADQYRQARY